MKKTLVTRSSMPPFNEYCEEIKDLWDSHWLTNMGIKHVELEKKLSSYLDVPHATCFVNGHLALESAIALFKFPKNSEVITTPFTFVSTTNAIVRNGLIPVFCDINNIDLTIDVTKIERLITSKTVAILAVHVYGNVCDVETIDKIASKYRLKVIYDAAHAFGVKYKNRGIGNYGDISMFSFHATKVFNTIEGGCLCYNDNSFEHVLRDMKNFGIQNEEECDYVGGNAKMNEFQAAMGLCNLRHVDEYIDCRKIISLKYYKCLKLLKSITLIRPQNSVKSNYSYFPVLFRNKKERDNAKKFLEDNGIFTRKYFYPLTNELAVHKNKYKGKTPIAKEISERVLTLPLYHELDLVTADNICLLITELEKKK